MRASMNGAPVQEATMVILANNMALTLPFWLDCCKHLDDTPWAVRRCIFFPSVVFFMLYTATIGLENVTRSSVGTLKTLHQLIAWQTIGDAKQMFWPLWQAVHTQWRIAEKSIVTHRYCLYKRGLFGAAPQIILLPLKQKVFLCRTHSWRHFFFFVGVMG